jgi:GNAT superfamily N-acetyltransferase
VSRASEVVVFFGGEADSAPLAFLRYEWRHGDPSSDAATFALFREEFLAWRVTHAASHVPFLASRSGRPIAMTWLALVERIPGPERFVRRSGYVQSTYVTPEERGHGRATDLVRRLLAHAVELELDYVAVHPSERAYPLYRRLGFVDSGKVLELRF